MNPQFTNGTISLRLFTANDAQFHLDHEDEEIVKWLSGKKGTLEGVKQWIAKNEESFQNGGPVFCFAIIDKIDTLLGMVEGRTDKENVPELEDGDVNISYALYREARGKGYATQAVALLQQFLAQKGFRRGMIRVNPENEPSLKVPERLGYESLGLSPVSKDEKLLVFVKKLK